ncbi:MAG: hypothetical protein HPY53_12685 [Brevinematales bacterium]|nr:hypothetical protein [Brevinematales bacterium]
MSEKDAIINGIETFIRKNGGDFGSWYVGITDDADKRLFVEHHVNEDSNNWTYYTADSHDEALEIEDYFMSMKRTDGEHGDGEDGADMVYAYKKSVSTNP